jgi:hypothetical protein
VIFTTKTSIGIDVDGTPPEASIAYSRVEGFIGPRYDNGAVPPVTSRLSTDGGLFSRSINQFYATGRAATLVSGGTESSPAVTALQGEKKAMFFGTSTTLGVKISFSATGAEGFTLGYRRKELSFIPVGKKGEVDTYASVIGVYATDVAASTVQDSKFGIAQYFATGAAADNIASWDETKASFRQSGAEAFGQYYKSVAAQNSEAVRAYRCFANVDDAKFGDVLSNANQLKLFQDSKVYDEIKAEKDLKKAKAAYIDELGISIGDASDRGARMLGHRAYVCDLAKKSS